MLLNTAPIAFSERWFRLQNTTCIGALQAKGAPELSKAHMTPLMLRFQGKSAVTVVISTYLSCKAELERLHHTRKIGNLHCGKYFAESYLCHKKLQFSKEFLKKKRVLKRCHWCLVYQARGCDVSFHPPAASWPVSGSMSLIQQKPFCETVLSEKAVGLWQV